MLLVEWLPYAVVLIIFLPFWLSARLLKKRQREQRSYGDEHETWTKGYF